VASWPALAAAVLLLRRKTGPMNMRALAVSFGRIVVASAVMGLVALGVSSIIGKAFGLPRFDFTLTAPAELGAGSGATISLGHIALQVLAAMGAGGAAFLVTLRLLGAAELSLALNTIRRIFARRAALESAPTE